MDGNPNCGVHLTCEGFTSREICFQNNIASQIQRLRFVNDQGIFMEILASMLQSKNIFTEFLAVSKKNPLDHDNQNRPRKKCRKNTGPTESFIITFNSAIPVEEELESGNIPVLRLETDYVMEDVGQLKTPERRRFSKPYENFTKDN
jgi:hypothetical protein